MFAVPGWAVSASSLVQEQPRSKNTDGKQNTSLSGTSSNKRKRSTLPSDSKTGQTKADKLAKRPTRANKSLESHVAKETKTKLFTETLPGDGAPKTQSRFQERDLGQGDREKSKKQGTRSSKENNSSLKNFHTKVDTKAATPAASVTQLTPLQAKMRSKLTSARFRHLNETLYTTTSSEALSLFTTSPELFADYHAGFAQQVKESWPQNPVDIYIKTIKSRGGILDPQKGLLPLPRRKTGSCTIADLGCGDAPLARGCQANIKSFTLKFHNYDLHAVNTFVTKADMSNLPMRDGEADIAVFCLSLMGTNWINFVEEAWRILRGDGKGEVWVAEVKSRFGRATKGRVVENSVGKRRKRSRPKEDDGEDDYGGPEQFAEDEKAPEDVDDETDTSAFIKVFTRRGFQLRDGSINRRNKMFVSMVFTKSGVPTAGKHKGLKWTGKEYQKQPDGRISRNGGQNRDEEITPEQEAKVLKPCVYKLR